jgi:hypothetical protein
MFYIILSNAKGWLSNPEKAAGTVSTWSVPIVTPGRETKYFVHRARSAHPQQRGGKTMSPRREGITRIHFSICAGAGPVSRLLHDPWTDASSLVMARRAVCAEAIPIAQVGIASLRWR